MAAQSSGGTSSAFLWVRPEVYTCSSVPVSPHPRLNLHNIKKIVTYAKNKGSSGYPNLSFPVWKHIACNKLQIPEDLAWMYMETYQLMSDRTLAEKEAFDEKMAACTNSQDIEKVRSQVSVNMLRFILMLFVQQVHKMSLRASIIAGDEWPLRTKSPDSEGRSTPAGSKGVDEHSHLQFILSHLNEIMELLVEPDSYVGDSSNDLSLSLDAVEALSLLVEGSLDKVKVKPLHDIATAQQMQSKSGFSKISRSFSYKTLQSWLRSNLEPGPFNLSICLQEGRRLSWSGAAGDDSTSQKRGKVATNAHIVPRELLRRHKIIIMSQCIRQTIARSSRTLEGASIKIHRCHSSYLYLLSPMRFVSIEKCRNTTIVLGAVEGSVYLQACEHVTVIAACRRISLSNCTLCTLHLLTATNPLILGGNDSITLAPYHTYYAKLEEHILTAGLSTKLNLWNQPFCIGPDHQDEQPVWDCLPPEEFYLFTIPFETSGNTKCVPCNIPSKYQKALNVRDKQIDTWQRTVKEAGLNKEQRKQFQSHVEASFQVWLAETGNNKQLDALVEKKPPEKSDK